MSYPSLSTRGSMLISTEDVQEAGLFQCKEKKAAELFSIKPLELSVIETKCHQCINHIQLQPVAFFFAVLPFLYRFLLPIYISSQKLVYF